MKIEDKSGLLDQEEVLDGLLEEMSQTANGPELEKAEELKNEAFASMA